MKFNVFGKTSMTTKLLIGGGAALTAAAVVKHFGFDDSPAEGESPMPFGINPVTAGMGAAGIGMMAVGTVKGAVECARIDGYNDAIDTIKGAAIPEVVDPVAAAAAPAAAQVQA